MTTEAQKARNARKRAKLKLHKKQAVPWRALVGDGWFHAEVAWRRVDGFCTEKVFFCVGDPDQYGRCSWHPAYQAWLNFVVSSLDVQRVDPGSIQVRLITYCRGKREYVEHCDGRYRMIDVECDLNALVRRLQAA